MRAASRRQDNRHHATTAFYNATAPGYTELHGTEQRAKYSLIKDHLTIPTPCTIADIGGGSGIVTDLFHEKSITTIVIDPSTELLRQSHATQNLLGDLEHIPLATASVNIILCVSAFHHAKNLADATKEFIRIGKGPASTWAITLLKKSVRYDSMRRALLKHFRIVHEIDNQQDTILVLRTKQKQ